MEIAGPIRGVNACGDEHFVGDFIELMLPDQPSIWIMRTPATEARWTCDAAQPCEVKITDDWLSAKTGRLYPTAFKVTLGTDEYEIKALNVRQEILQPEPSWRGWCQVLQGGKQVGNATLECRGYRLTSEKEMAFRWCRGDQDAIFLFHLLARCSHYADDFVDEDVPERDRSKDMSRLLFNLVAVLPNNAFYQKNRATLEPLVINAVMYFDASNEWAKSDVKETRMFGFAYRESLEAVLVMIAILLGGYDWGRRVIREVHDYYHVLSGSTFEKWEAEGHGSV